MQPFSHFSPRIWLLVTLWLLPALPVLADLVNGDFETGDFTGWTTDTDGSGAPTPLAPDFQVIDNGGNHQGRLEADYWSTPGDTTSTPQDQVMFSNTLFQGLGTVDPSTRLQVTFDYTFAGQVTPPNENVQVGFTDGTDFYGSDGQLGFLLSLTDAASGSFQVEFDPAVFANLGGIQSFNLGFQLNAGFDGQGSYLLLDNIAVTSAGGPPGGPTGTYSTVPTLSEWGLLLLCLLLLVVVSRQIQISRPGV